MRSDGYLKTAWIMTVLFSIILPLHSQTPRQFSIELKDKPLPAALKLIEKEGGKNIIFSYNETESYRVTASIRQKTELEAIGTVLNGIPFICKEREEYFAIQKKGRDIRITEIRGQVTNEKNEPLPYSNVLLLTPGDSTFVNGCVTREDGSFLMIAEEGIPYLIRVSYIGYKTEVQPCHPTLTFHLLPDTQLMQEVTISARRPMIEVGPNGLKANVAGTSLARMGSAAEMLPHLPFVTGHNGEYNVMGCGSPVIYINNKKVRDMTELDRIRANEILSAEVITTPGAEYASDVAAVIRLRTIRRRGQGLSGHFNTTYSQGHSANANEYMALNYRTGGLDLFVKGYMAQQNSYGKTTNMNRIKGSAIWQTNKNDVQTHKSDLENQIEQLARQRKVLYRQKQEPERAAREEQIQKLTKQIKALRHEFYICADIEADAAMVQEKLRQAELAAQQERNEVKEDEYKRRSSRPDGARGASVFRGGY